MSMENGRGGHYTLQSVKSYFTKKSKVGVHATHEGVNRNGILQAYLQLYSNYSIADKYYEGPCC